MAATFDARGQDVRPWAVTYAGGVGRVGGGAIDGAEDAPVIDQRQGRAEGEAAIGLSLVKNLEAAANDGLQPVGVGAAEEAPTGRASPLRLGEILQGGGRGLG